jgi:hypothetical protein
MHYFLTTTDRTTSWVAGPFTTCVEDSIYQILSSTNFNFNYNNEEVSFILISYCGPLTQIHEIKQELLRKMNSFSTGCSFADTCGAASSSTRCSFADIIIHCTFSGIIKNDNTLKSYSNGKNYCLTFSAHVIDTENTTCRSNELINNNIDFMEPGALRMFATRNLYSPTLTIN